MSIIKQFNVRPAELEDYYQEAFLGLLKSSKKFDAGRGIKFSSYIYKNIYWTIAKYYMKEKKYTSKKYKTEREISSAIIYNPKDVCSTLTNNEANIINKYIYENLTFKEIAIAMNMPKSTIYRQYKSGIDKLKNAYK